MESRKEAAKEVAVMSAMSHGVVADRCDVLQDGHTLVLRLSETLVARVVTGEDGPRQGMDWFSREIAVAGHLASAGAPVIPCHPDIPPGPHERAGFPINFWKFVTKVDEEPDPGETGRTLFQCHAALASFPGRLPEMAILTESLGLIDELESDGRFSGDTAEVLRRALSASLEALSAFPRQALHGDAHPGNLLPTTDGLLWTDWEDTFHGPVEWDLASIIWNARFLDEDHGTAEAILDAYRAAGGTIDAVALEHCLVARAAVMSAWYPVLYPDPSPERVEKLERRIAWLKERL